MNNKLETFRDSKLKQLNETKQEIDTSYGGWNRLKFFVDSNFKSKFNRATQLFQMPYDANDIPERIKMIEMMLRAYEQLLVQVKKLNINKLDPNTRVFCVNDHLYYVVDNQHEIKFIQQKLGKSRNSSFISIEELLRCIPKDIRNIRESLNYQFDAVIERIE